MNLKLTRFEFGDTYTIGKLYVDNVFECYTLEDKVRPLEEKILNKTAIPAGTFKVIIDMSNRFKKEMPHILNVPGFEGVRIHSGNTDKDTEGCILLGTTWTKGNFIGNSKIAFNSFFKKLLTAKEAVITIK